MTFIENLRNRIFGSGRAASTDAKTIARRIETVKQMVRAYNMSSYACVNNHTVTVRVDDDARSFGNKKIVVSGMGSILFYRTYFEKAFPATPKLNRDPKGTTLCLIEMDLKELQEFLDAFEL